MSTEHELVDPTAHHKHMDYIQAIVSRLAGNSFVMKGWAVTLATAVLGFSVSQEQAQLAIAATVPVLAFWGLDTYFLRHERAFRLMFADVAAKKVIDFKIEVNQYVTKVTVKSVLGSPTLLFFYGPLLIVVALVFVALAWPLLCLSP